MSGPALPLRPACEPADDGGRQWVHPATRERRRPEVRQVCGPQDPRDELPHVDEARRVLDLLCQAGLRSRSVFDRGMQDAETRYERLRDAHSADVERRGGVAGLVSILASDTRPKTPCSDLDRKRSSLLARAASATLGDALRMFSPDADAGRIAKLRMAVGFSARVHLTDAPTDRVAMVTLTYRDATKQWEPRHISAFIKTLREFMRRRGHSLRYAWVAELQKRGAAGLHYHVAVWLPEGVVMPKPDAAGWWLHGMTNVEFARSAPAYLMKYLSKGNKATDHRLPHRARAYGVGGLGSYWRTARRWLGLPGFIKARADLTGSRDWVRWPGGGWMNTAAGTFWPSEYRLANVGVARMLERVADHGRPFEPSGVFCWRPWASTPSA